MDQTICDEGLPQSSVIMGGDLGFKSGGSLFFRITQLIIFTIHAGQQIKSTGFKCFFDHPFRCGNFHLSLDVVELLAREDENPDAATADVVHIS